MLALIAVLAAGLAIVGNLAFAQPVSSNDGCLAGSQVHCAGQLAGNETQMADVFGTNNVTGTISSMLLPVESNDSMDSMMPDPARQKAMQFSMAQNVTWILAGDWSLSQVAANGSKMIDFEASFTKVTTDGMMRHTHRITNFTLPADAASYPALTAEPAMLSITGKTDLYFNDQLAWKQAGINLQVLNGVLTIRFDSADIDNHFHDMPIYGVAK